MWKKIQTFLCKTIKSIDIILLAGVGNHDGCMSFSYCENILLLFVYTILHLRVGILQDNFSEIPIEYK